MVILCTKRKKVVEYLYYFEERELFVKILIASDLFDPSISGIVTSVKILAKGLKDNGHDVKILSLSDTGEEKRIGNAYLIASTSASKIYPKARIGLPKKNTLMQELIDWNPDVIHTNCEFSTFAASCHISKRTKAPIVHTYHTVYEAYVGYLSFAGFFIKKTIPNIMRSVSRRADCFIAPTQKIHRILTRYRIKNKIYVIPSAIDEFFFNNDYSSFRDETREKYGIRKDECLLLFLGRIAKEKNIEELLDYLADDELKDFRIMLAGDGPYIKKIENYCKKLGIFDRVIFTGMINPEDVPKYYMAGDVFINASTSETQGLTYMEAMACSLPILCRYDSCLDGVIKSEENGFVYNTKEEFIHYIKLLCDNVDLRKSVGANAKKTVFDKYTPKAYVEACEKVYLALHKN